MRTVVLAENVLHPVSARLRDLLEKKIDPDGPALVSLDQADEQLDGREADMLVVLLSPNPERALGVLRRVRSRQTGPVLAVGQASESKLILRALHEGADHYLDETELETHLQAVLQRLRPQQGAGFGQAGRLVSLLGCSGGSGASTLAVNLAAVLARDHAKCALIDLKPGTGDLAALLDLKPVHSLADLCINARRLDRSMFESALAAHPSGIHLLAPPQVYEDIRLVTAQGVQQALELSRQLFPFTVVDLEDCFHEEQACALRQSDVILLVLRLEFTSLRNACRILDYLQHLDGARERVRLVANRHGQAKELPASEAEVVLGGKVSYFVPDDPKTINGSNNTGVPAVLKAPSTKVAQSILQLAASCHPKPAPSSSGARSLAKSFQGWLASFHS